MIFAKGVYKRIFTKMGIIPDNNEWKQISLEEAFSKKISFREEYNYFKPVVFDNNLKEQSIYIAGIGTFRLYNKFEN